MKFFKRRIVEPSLETVYAEADWPRQFNITIRMANGESIGWNNVNIEGMRVIQRAAETGNGAIDLVDNKTNKIVTISAQYISTIQHEEVEFKMWNEDSL